MWTASKDGLFSVSSFLPVISNRSRERNVVGNIWKLKAPPRVAIFEWLAIRKRILTRYNFRRMGRIVVNACPMCLRRDELVDHLMVTCKTAHYIWISVIGWFDCCWVFPNSLPVLFQAWKASIGAPRGKELWRLYFLAIIWTIWKERNSTCFEGVGTCDSHLVGKARFLVALWVSISPSFRGYSIEQIMLQWKELAFSFAGPN